MGAYYVEHQIKLQGNSVLFLKKHDVIVVLALCALKRCLMMCVSVDNKLIVCDVGVDLYASDNSLRNISWKLWWL